MAYWKFGKYDKTLYSHQWWKEYIDDKNRVTLSSNTFVEIDNNNLIKFYLHGNNIATVSHLNRWQLSSCGWETHTTKKRLNQLTPIKLWQKDYYWFYEDENGCEQLFEDGIIVDHRSKREDTLCWKKLSISSSVL